MLQEVKRGMETVNFLKDSLSSVSSALLPFGRISLFKQRFLSVALYGVTA